MSEITPPSAGKAALYRVEDLLQFRFCIPSFQRPYDWLSRQVDDFIKDLIDSTRKGRPLFLGMLVLAPHDSKYLIIDGQQRLTTLMLALAAQGESSVVRKRGDQQKLWIYPREEDALFLERMLNGKAGEHESLSQRLLSETYERLKEAEDLSITALLRCEIIVYVAPHIFGATALFERINTRGREVSQFDLVKNKLIDWCGSFHDLRVAEEMVHRIDSSYNRLHRLLNPSGHAAPYDTERLLRVHWIMFDPGHFKSGDRVLEKLELQLQTADERSGRLSQFIENYLDSLVRVTEMWVKVERPLEHPSRSAELNDALLDFQRLDREAEFQPLLVSALLRSPERDCSKLVRLATIMSFRDGLAKRRGNYGRSRKWRFAREFSHNEVTDAAGNPVNSIDELMNLLFWTTGSWWDANEARQLESPMAELLTPADVASTAFASSKFYLEFGPYIRYFFWNYGCAINAGLAKVTATRVHLSAFNEAGWAQFKNWDVEHIYPQVPELNKATDRKHSKLMAPYLHHLGNLTMLPQSDNRSLKNVDFNIKLKAMERVIPVNFNELLSSVAHRGNLMDKPYWGPGNCKRRARNLQVFANGKWGLSAVIHLGIRKFDHTVDFARDADSDENVSNE